ncbi:hypothetical protein AB0M46_48360 [Dactylosporangium sp. NPDC051485]|uniref:hypothetical protein n=1 Tax=Dactylosporangium sp. NPDC051485 TaxID=3154846 RepID=UPI003432D409
MPDLIEDAFARFAEEYSGTFRPVPVEAMPRWRRARRRGVWWLGGLAAALAAALTATALQPAAPDDTPNRVVERTVRLAGARGTMYAQFTDAAHGWVLFSDCPSEYRCTATLGRTTDGGRGWAPVALPDLPGDAYPMLDATGPDSALVGAVRRDHSAAWWETTDAGRTFWAAPDLAEPALTDWLNTRRGGADPASAHWRVEHDGLVTRASYSPDGGSTWRALPVELPARGTLRVTRDDREAWVVAELPNRVFRLTPDAAAEVPGFPAAATVSMVGAVGGGGLLVTLPGAGTGVWRDGRFTPFPPPLARAADGRVLRDGSIALHLPDEGLIVGAEGGPWIWYRPSVG